MEHYKNFTTQQWRMIFSTIQLSTRGRDKSMYNMYIKSNAWRAKRQEALAEHGCKCVLCGADYQAIHHLHYRNLGDEDVARDLRPVCKRCHTAIHKSGLYSVLRIIEKQIELDPLTKLANSLFPHTEISTQEVKQQIETQKEQEEETGPDVKPILELAARIEHISEEAKRDKQVYKGVIKSMYLGLEIDNHPYRRGVLDVVRDCIASRDTERAVQQLEYIAEYGTVAGFNNEGLIND